MHYRLILAVIVLSLFASLLSAQVAEHHRFVNPDNEWSVLYWDFFSPNTTTIRYRFTEDSVQIGDQYYFTMEENREETGDNWHALTSYYREESGKVYTHQYGNEYEVYDFTLNVPDSFSLEILGEPDFFMLTNNVEDITFQDQVTRKRLTMSCYSDPENWHHHWIQGIGDIDLGPFGSSCLYDVNSKLLCFYYQGNLVYTSDFDTCFRTSTKDIIKDHDVKIFPNPATDKIFIQTELSFTEVSIFNALGKIMLSSEQFGDGVDVSNLPHGLYYIRLTNADNKFATLTFSKF